jgi:hypothetical protein
MSNNKIEFRELTDLERLPEIHALAYEGLLENGYILPNTSQQKSIHPHLDNLEETSVIVGECNGQIIATDTITIDGSQGLSTDVYFGSKTNEIRRQYGKIACLWRFCTEK